MKKTIFGLVSLLAIAGYAYAPYLIFYVAPIQGKPLFFNQKIFYYHVPCAMMLFLSVIICGVFSGIYLKTRKAKFDDVAVAAGDAAILFGIIVLLTGVIWAKPAWNVWWTWDARLTMSLLLWLTMLGYGLIRRYGGAGSERLAAGLAFVASVLTPMVYFSVKFWRTLHPQTSVVPGLRGEMLFAFLGSMVVFLVFFILLMRLRINIVRGHRRLFEVRERGLDAGLFE